MVGPTASGKTSLGVRLCKLLGGEVVSCDSMQIYRKMDIATAKPTPEEMEGVPHHLIGFLDVFEPFSVARYCELAGNCVDEIVSRGKCPVLVGGTGLYYSSFVDNISFLPEASDFEYRDYLKARAEKEGAESLLDELMAIDPESASRLHVNNVGRIIRALEIYHTTGMTITEQNAQSRSAPSKYDFHTVCLDARDRNILYDRINRRVDVMLENGLLEEAESFFRESAGRTAVQAIGYKELKPYLDGTDTLQNCVENLKLQTRHYAKRQLTWFRRDPRIRFIYIDDYDSVDLMTDDVLRYFGKKSGES